MTTVRDILKNKAIHTVHGIDASATSLEAVKVLARRNVGALVVHDHHELVGIFSERDYLRRIALEGLTPADVLVRDVMTSPIVTVRPSDDAEACMSLMTNRRVRHLPVVDRGAVVGLVSIGDLVKDIISDQRFVIEQLENYITGVA